MQKKLEEMQNKWEEEKHELLMNAPEVVTEGERRMEERVKEVERKMRGEVEEVKKKAAEKKDCKRQSSVNVKMMTPSAYKEGSCWKDWRAIVMVMAHPVLLQVHTIISVFMRSGKNSRGGHTMNIKRALRPMQNS